MKITDILSEEAISPSLRARDKHGVIKEMSELLVNCIGVSDKERLAEVIMEREQLGSTGIGFNIAIPHAKVQEVNGVVAALGRSKDGVDFGAVDGEPVNLFFFLISGLNTSGTHLKALARISRLLKNAETRESLISCETKEEMYEIISREDSKFD